MAQLVASSLITDSCAVVRIMLRCEMRMYLFGLFVGAVCGFVIMLSACLYEKQSMVKAGWIQVNGEFYTLRKTDAVEVK